MEPDGNFFKRIFFFHVFQIAIITHSKLTFPWYSSTFLCTLNFRKQNLVYEFEISLPYEHLFYIHILKKIIELSNRFIFLNIFYCFKQPTNHIVLFLVSLCLKTRVFFTNFFQFNIMIILVTKILFNRVFWYLHNYYDKALFFYLRKFNLYKQVVFIGIQCCDYLISINLVLSSNIWKNASK